MENALLGIPRFRAAFPKLSTSNFEVTSPEDIAYNCIAWAAEDDSRKWWPIDGSMSHYWPDGVRYSEDPEAFIEAYATIGYSRCQNGDLEPHLEKVALYGKEDLLGRMKIKHAARQQPSGRWTSKLGDFQDIAHSIPDDVGGGDYGEVVCYLSRLRQGMSDKPCKQQG
ncbi:MAG: hypothetical protein OXN96_01555 [Bryobacterales bacterium]|nr:hypothetical protein [Bryobacterales bacterium]